MSENIRHKRKAQDAINFKAQELRDLHKSVKRLRALEEFKASPFYNEHFLPWLQEQEKTDKDCTWRPTSIVQTTERIALGAAYNGGFKDFREEQYLAWKSWSAEGQTAEYRLKKLAEKK